MSVDGADDLLAVGQNRLDVFIENELELLQHLEIIRFAGNDVEDIAVNGQREDAVFARYRFGHQLNDRLSHCDINQVDELEFVKVGNGAHHFFRRGVGELHECFLHFDAGLVRQTAGFFKLVFAQHALADQNVCKIIAGFGHGGHSPETKAALVENKFSSRLDDRISCWTMPAIETPLVHYPVGLEPISKPLPNDIEIQPPDRRGHE